MSLFLPQRELSHAAAVAAYTALPPSLPASHWPLAVCRYVMATPTLAQSMQAPLKFCAFCGFLLVFLLSLFNCLPVHSPPLSRPSPFRPLFLLTFICLQLTLQHATCATFLCALSCSIWHFSCSCSFFIFFREIFSLRWFSSFSLLCPSFWFSWHPQCVSLFISFVRSPFLSHCPLPLCPLSAVPL